MSGCEGNAEHVDNGDGKIRIIYGHDCARRDMVLRLRWPKGLWEKVEDNAILT